MTNVLIAVYQYRLRDIRMHPSVDLDQCAAFANTLNGDLCGRYPIPNRGCCGMRISRSRPSRPKLIPPQQCIVGRSHMELEP